MKKAIEYSIQYDNVASIHHYEFEGVMTEIWEAIDGRVLKSEWTLCGTLLNQEIIAEKINY